MRKKNTERKKRWTPRRLSCGALAAAPPVAAWERERGRGKKGHARASDDGVAAPPKPETKKRCLFPSFSTIPFHSALLTLIAAFFTKWFLRIHFRSGEARSCAAVRLFAERYAANASLVGANSVVLSFGSESFSVRFAALTAASSVDSAGVAAATEAMEDSAEYFIF